MGSIPERVASLEKACTSTLPLFDWYTRLYRTVVSREIALVDIGPDDTILNIGCGAMPFTAVLLARETDATVYALDRDPSILPAACENLEAAGVGDRVEVCIEDGRAVPGDGTTLPAVCSVAVLALQAEPKDAILERLWRSQNGPDRVLVRQPRSLFASSYDAVCAHAPTDFVTHYMPTFDRSLLFERP